MTPNALIWVTAQDGTVHATRPPILAAGHGTVCGLLFGRRDLRIREQAAPGGAPANSCRVCRETVARAFADTSEDQAVTQMLNGFQRSGRAMLEELLPSLHHPKECPDAIIEGWGDVHEGRSGASTVTLVSAKCAPADDRTRLLARVRLGRDADQTWTATVWVVASPDTQITWPPPGPEQDWWAAQRDHIRARIAQHRHPASV